MPSLSSAASLVKKISRHGSPMATNKSPENQKHLHRQDSRSPLAALQTAIVVTDIVASIAETIPVFGTPIKGALEAICKVLRVIEVAFSCGNLSRLD
jgi:hypothetical protein